MRTLPYAQREIGIFRINKKIRYGTFGSLRFSGLVFPDDPVSFIHRQMFKKYLRLLPFNGRLGISPTHLTKQFPLPLFVHDLPAFFLVFLFGYQAVFFQAVQFPQFRLKIGGVFLIRGQFIFEHSERRCGRVIWGS